MTTRLFRFDPTGAEAAPPLGDRADITVALAARGVSLAAWPVPAPAAAEALLAALAPALDAEAARFGYTSRDVVVVTPAQSGARTKFLAEHTHADDEARFFAAGTGTFYLHYPEHAEVLALVCAAGDWIRVPAGTAHWFDMGAAPDFTAVRLFTRPDGWVAAFTGAEPFRHFPSHDELAAR